MNSPTSLEKFNTPPETSTQRSPERLLHELANDEDIAQLIDKVQYSRVQAGQINEIDVSYSPGDVESMKQAMESAFKFRKNGGERNDRESLPSVDSFRSDIAHIATKYGFTGDTIPEQAEAAAGIVLGGRATGSWDRTRYTRELLENGALKTNTLVFLGSSRPADKLDFAADKMFENAADEYDIMKLAAAHEFNVEFEDDEIQGHDATVATGFEQGWRIAHSHTKDGLDIFILGAPMLTDTFHGDGNRRARANTGDTLNMFAKVANYENGSHVVAVTNAHFKPFQGADAVTQLSAHGTTAEVVGYEPEHYRRPAKEPEEILQEIFSAVNSCVKAVKK